MENEYNQNLPKYKKLLAEAEYILKDVLSVNEIKTHSILGRVKEFASLSAKADRKNLKAPLVETTDLVGLRIICLLRSDIKTISDLIKSNFQLVSEDNKIVNEDISSFGYHSVHFILKMKNEFSGPRYDDIKDQVFEVQLRTVAMDAWATVSHYIDYKSDADVPKSLRKDFYALSGLFYVVDTHFELFYQAGEKSKEYAIESVSNESVENDKEFNLDTLRAYLGTVSYTHLTLPTILLV